jgi:hypothetical protein
LAELATRYKNLEQEFTDYKAAKEQEALDTQSTFYRTFYTYISS